MSPTTGCPIAAACRRIWWVRPVSMVHSTNDAVPCTAQLRLPSTWNTERLDLPSMGNPQQPAEGSPPPLTQLWYVLTMEGHCDWKADMTSEFQATSTGPRVPWSNLCMGLAPSGSVVLRVKRALRWCRPRPWVDTPAGFNTTAWSSSWCNMSATWSTMERCGCEFGDKAVVLKD